VIYPALALALINPLHVGPAPSAHATELGWNAGADASLIVGGPRTLGGARVVAALTPYERIWSGLEVGYGAGFRFCPDCGSFAATWTARGTIIQSRYFHAAAWSWLVLQNGLMEWMPGLAVEGGTKRLRFDASTPVWSTYDLLTTMRVSPEIGVSWLWNDAQITRLAVVGLEPSLALTHRYRTKHLVFEGQARIGEEGLALLLGARLFFAAFD
jgi:hypothetical protein